jgi:DNA-directed RNA polymerase specialized sigma24 family protein
MREIDADFAAYVRARQLRLLRAAQLVCGDLARAERLVLHAFTSLALHWDHVRARTPDAYVRPRVHRAALTAAEADERAGGASPAVPFRLRRLTPRQRAVLVLRWYDGRTVDDTAGVLGMSREQVRERADAGRVALASGDEQPPSDVEVTALLEAASAPVREVDLAERAWHDALLHRSTTRRRALTGVAAAALVVGGAALAGHEPTVTGLTVPSPVSLTPVPRAEQAVWRTTADGLRYVVAPPAGTESTLPPLRTGLPEVIDPRSNHRRVSTLAPGVLGAFGDAVYLEERSPGRWVPVVVWGDGEQLTVDTVLLTDVRTTAGVSKPPLGIWAFSGDKTMMAFAQPGKVVVFDVGTRTVRTTAIPSPTLEWASWRGNHLLAGSADGTWSPGLSPLWPGPEPPRRPGAREYRVVGARTVLDDHPPNPADRPTPVGWPRTRPVGETVSDADQYASAFSIDADDARDLVAVRPRNVIVATNALGRDRMLVFGEEQPRSTDCCSVLGWTVRGELVYLSVAPSETWVMAWNVETGIVHRVSHFLTSDAVPPVIALGARFTVG